jgi:hypothetical protein
MIDAPRAENRDEAVNRPQHRVSAWHPQRTRHACRGIARMQESRSI